MTNAALDALHALVSDDYVGVMSEWQAMELVKAKTGLKNPPPWVYCALTGRLYVPNSRGLAAEDSK